MKLFEKIFGTYSSRQLKKITPIVDEIEKLADKYEAMSDDELRAQTDVLKQRLAGGETLDDILPDAFAVVREADWRVLEKRPFRVQLIGGIVLHQGRIAEMKTGEGKTLVATLPAYLNALDGKGVHIVTVNEYLARCGMEEMGRVYGFLGLSTGLVIHDQTKDEKRAAYACDITYGTNNEFGFDYLRDNMAVYKRQLVQRGHAFAIVDEVDSILIDEARTPLIISGEGEESTEMYDKADSFVRTLRPLVIKEQDSKEDSSTLDYDYIVDEKARTTTITERGVGKAEQFFGIENLSDPENSTLSHHINNALRAHGIMKNDVDYVVKDGQVLIVDSFTGRIMPGRRYSDGLHQAIEAKEHVDVEKETKTLATITFQNFFRMYGKLSGMTGTALTEEMEFREIYNLDVIEIPTNKPMIRIDHNDVVYRSVKEKYHAIVNQIKECHEKGQPVLAGTVSIDKSEILSTLLRREGIPHVVLNAKHHEKEAEIVAGAGKLGMVTIATNMAGRGTDIMLGGNPEFMAKTEMKKQGYEDDMIGNAVSMSVTSDPEILAARKVYHELFEKFRAEIEPEYEKVKELGGLFIIGTERHEARRIDNQLRGRSGRQGDPGESRFFLSFEDDLMRLFGSERVLNLVQNSSALEDTPIDMSLFSDVIESAQKKLEDNNFARRKNVLTYDDVMNQQRTVIYNQRREVLDGVDLKDKIHGMIESTVRAVIAANTASEDKTEWNFGEIRNYFMGTLCRPDDFSYTEEELNSLTAEKLTDEMLARADEFYAGKEELFGADSLREIERVILLQNVDKKWMDHLDAMDDLKGSIGLHAYAQRNPINEYRIQGADMFDEMSEAIREDTVRMLFSAVPRPKEEIRRVQVARVTNEGFAGGKVEKPAPKVVKKAERVGRNDPCPCGSGKKYKKCCGANTGAADDEE